MEAKPISAFKLLQLVIALLVLSMLIFFLLLYSNGSFTDLVFFSSLPVIAAFVIAIIGFMKGLRYKATQTNDQRNNTFAMIGHLIFILGICTALVIAGIELTNFL